MNVTHVGEIKTVRISRKLLLGEILRELGAPPAGYKMNWRNSGFCIMLKASVPDARKGLDPVDTWIYSDGPWQTVGDGEEEAAHRMINCLKRKHEFEVDNANWTDKYLYCCGRYKCVKEWHALKEENGVLKKIIRYLRQGWKATLGELNIVHDMAYALLCCTAFTAYSARTSAVLNEVLGNTTDLESHAMRALTEATSALDGTPSEES